MVQYIKDVNKLYNLPTQATLKPKLITTKNIYFVVINQKTKITHGLRV